MLWKSINDLIWNQRSLEASEVVESAYSILNQWQNVQDRTFDSFMRYMSPDDSDEHLNLPSFNSVMINSDAAIFKESDIYNYAFVIRDHVWVLIEVRSKCLWGSPTADLVKAIGIWEALSWIKNRVIVLFNQIVYKWYRLSVALSCAFRTWVELSRVSSPSNKCGYQKL